MEIRKIMLENWKLAGFWPYTPIQDGSMETGQIHKGVTGILDAKVPGSVYMDLWRAGMIEDPYYERNSLLCEWVKDRWWEYHTSFRLEEKDRGGRVRIFFLGIDDRARIYINDRFCLSHEGMYEQVELDISAFARFGGEENTVRVILESAQDEMGQIGYTSGTHTQKARFTYKWDFCTRMVGMGLWDEVYVLVTGGAVIGDEQILYENGCVTGKIGIEGAGDGASLTAVLSRDGFCRSAVASVKEDSAEFSIPVENPTLWYPNGYGEQPLYDLTLTLTLPNGTISDEKHRKTGLRTLSYERCDGATEETLPYIPVINGKKIYIKGVNMTPVDMMYGCVGEEQYRRLLTLARDANINLIRVWGGGIIEKEAFYSLCDAFGIMVWQEFIQSSSGIDNIPSKDPAFLRLLEKTAVSAVKRRRNHVSLTFWSGGNELMDASGHPSGFDDVNIAMLKEITQKLDPKTLMLPTSASGPTEWQDDAHPERNQDVHGPWKYQGVTEQYSLFNRSSIQLHSEFGCDGMTNPEMLSRIFKPENRDRPYTIAENLSWCHHGEWWDTYSYRDMPLFGDMDDNLLLFITVSQFMQAEGIRYALEANRRRAWKNGGSIIWQLNEPWPNVSCTNLIDYSGKPKFAYWLTRDALKPFHISLRYDSLVWHAGDRFCAVPFVHDGETENKAACVRLTALSSARETLAEQTGTAPFTFSVPAGIRSFVVVCRAEADGKKDENRYLYFVTSESEPKCDASAVVSYMEWYHAEK